MNRFLFFTKTNWSESPRLRHQVASLLADRGHEVFFFQKPSWLLSGVDESNCTEINLLRSAQLIHHQLRVCDFLADINNFFEAKSIARELNKFKLAQRDVIVNFNYDYFFLRKLFPDSKIVTIINDDFVAQSRFLKGRHAKRALARTCKISNAVLTVSVPIKNQLAEWSEPELFLPWSEHEYSAPFFNEKKSLLIWASINQIIDVQLLDKLAKKFPFFNFSLIGPVSSGFEATVNSLLAANSNIKLSPPRSLAEIDFNDYFAGLMPYRSGNASTEAVTLANKSLRLMSKGLPLIVHGMPHFLEHEAIFKCATLDDIYDSVEVARNKFWDLQAGIEALVRLNTPAHRYQQFMQIINHD